MLLCPFAIMYSTHQNTLQTPEKADNMASTSDLPVPTGSTVDVSVILAGLVTYPASMVIKEPLPGHEILPGTPCYSFLIENRAMNKKILFDLGLVKAWRTKLPPVGE
jgi:hypothetical protein